MNLRAPEEQTCRLCTNQGVNYTPIFKKNEGDVVRMIRCLPVQIRSNDGLPSHICPGCLQALNVSYNLHILCLKANLKLLESSSSLRTKNLVERGRTRVERREKVESKSREGNKSSKDNSESVRDPIIVEAFHFPEAVYNNHQEFSKIFQKVPAVKLERVDDSASTSSKNDVNHNQVFENVQCKQEPIDIDEAGPSGHQQRTPPSPEKMDNCAKANVKDENGAWRAGTQTNEFREPQRTCQDCGKTCPVSDFLLKRVKYNRKRVRADVCKICEEKNPPVDNRRSRIKDNQPCRSIENVQEAENNEPEIIDLKDFEGYMNIPNEHSYARFARSCALKTIWKQQLASTKPSPKARKPRKEKLRIKVDHSCVICGKEHPSAHKLKHHIAVYHTPPDQWEYSCNRCGDKFPLLQDIKRHEMWNHKDERKFPCDVCPASFTTNHGIILHKMHRHRIIKREDTNDNP